MPVNNYQVRWDPTNKLWEVSEDGGAFADLVENATHETTIFNEIAAPAVSDAGTSKIYMDSTGKKLMLSEDNGAYSAILTAAGFAAGIPLTTKGDLFTYDTDDARLAVGTDGYKLVSDSGEATGLKWIKDSAYYCSVYLTGDETISTATITAIPWDAAGLDDASFWSGGAPTRLTAPIDGLYAITFGVLFEQFAAIAARVTMSLYKNGAILRGTSSEIPVPATTFYPSFNGSWMGNLNATDYIELRVYHNRGGDETVDSVLTGLSIKRLGAKI